MMKKMKKSLFVVFILVLTVFATGCGGEQDGEGKKTAADLSPITVAVNDFGARMLQSSFNAQENFLISPLSVMYSLAMTANGAEGETLKQMEAVLGMPIDDLNSYLCWFMSDMPMGDKFRLNLANSLWLDEAESIEVNPEFLQKNEDYYGAEIFTVPFNDEGAAEINDWVNKQTNGMIKNIIEKIPNDSAMYLINALAMEAEWKDEYESIQVHDDVFTTDDGEKQKTDFMYSNESCYLENDDFIGVRKDYGNGGKYAFVGLLPKVEGDLEKSIDKLNGEKLAALIQSEIDAVVKTAIPKFKCEYEIEMKEALENMGMTNAFDSAVADFTKLGSSNLDGNIFVSEVLQKTYIAVDEKGTKAAAATAVDLATESAVEEDPEVKRVYLDRPFIYLIMDVEHNVPLFMGTVCTFE